MSVFWAINTVLVHLFHFFADAAQDFVSMGHKAAAYVGFGQAIAIFLYSVADFLNLIALEIQIWIDVNRDAIDVYRTWIDGSLIQNLFDTVMRIVSNEYGEPSDWLKNEITDLMPMLGRAIFEGQNLYDLDFWDHMTNVLYFFYAPGLLIPWLLNFANLEWGRLFTDTLGWLRDRLAELGWVWPDWLDDPVTWLWDWLVEWGLTDGGLPDDILAWLWDWLLSTAEPTFERIKAPFQSLASKMLRYLIEGEFAE